MAKLNDRTDKTKGVIHLMVTSLCDRNCPHCCNKQYDLNEIPYVTNEEFKEAHTVFITGGEPFKYSNPVEIANSLKDKYKNIKSVYVYTNAKEFVIWAINNNNLSKLKHSCINGLNISIKNKDDFYSMCCLLEDCGSKFLDIIDNLGGRSRIYDFIDTRDYEYFYKEILEHFDYFKREWQEDFEAADDSIFRKA